MLLILSMLKMDNSSVCQNFRVHLFLCCNFETGEPVLEQGQVGKLISLMFVIFLSLSCLTFFSFSIFLLIVWCRLIKTEATFPSPVPSLLYIETFISLPSMSLAISLFLLLYIYIFISLPPRAISLSFFLHLYIYLFI